MIVEKTDKIGLGVITYRRPDGLRRLLESFAALTVPRGVEVVVLIAENDQVLTIDALLAKLAHTFPFPVKSALEPEQGIPFARNRVLDMAAAEGCDYLTFVDDDDVVHHDWLLMLYTACAGRGLDLVGGPITYKAPAGRKLTKQQNAVLYMNQQRGANMLKGRTSMVATPKEGEIPIYTHNWMVRLATQQAYGVRFDQSFRFSGGSDAKFYEDFVAMGGKSGWSTDARIYETWPPERLTYRYLFERMRDQQVIRSQLSSTTPSLHKALCGVLVSVIKAAVAVIRAPATRHRSLARAAVDLGGAVGCFKAARGKLSQLYDPKG